MKHLSIIIPTRNRYEYLYFSLLSILESFSEVKKDIEIIIHDNSDVPMPQNLHELIDENPEILYRKIEGWISAWGNFEQAISLASGKFLTMIGDDDSLCKQVMEYLKVMDSEHADALISPFAHYLWPDIESRIFKNNLSGVLSFASYTGKIKTINHKAEIRKLLNSGGTALTEIPKMYYGIVRRNILDEVKKASGFYLPGPSPDMANSVSMSMFLGENKLMFVDKPLFIAGNSSKSTAGMGAKGKHVGKIEEISFLPKNCANEWEELVPRFWSGPTIWAESAIKAIKKTGHEELLKDFNFPALYASSIVFNPEWNSINYETLNRYITSEGKSKTVVYIQLYWEIAKIWKKRFYFLIKNFEKVTRNKTTETPKFSDVYQATKYLEKQLGN